MKAMILAAGGGTRLYPLTFKLPKPMAPLLNKPVMEYIIKHLSAHGFNDLVINLHKCPEAITDYFSDGSRLNVNITYSCETTPLGTAGGVKNVGHLFTETFMVIGGDDLSDIDLTKIVQFHKEKKALATIGLTWEEDVEHYGVVVTDEDDRITEFQEKPPQEEAKSNWANNGIYIFEPEILDLIPEGEFFDFGSQLFPMLKEKNAPFYGYKCEGYWKDIGKLMDYRQAHMDSLTGKVEIEFPGTEIMEGIRAEDIIAIPHDAKLTPPILFGKHCRLGKNVTIEGPVVVGSYNVFEDDTYIKKTIMWNNNHLKKGVRLTDCLMGNGCTIRENQVYEQAVLGCNLSHILEDYFYKSMKDIISSRQQNNSEEKKE